MTTSYLDSTGLETLVGEIDDNYVSRSASTVGGTAKPIYVSGGAATACSSTVGSGTKPVYLSSGTVTASSSTVGSGTKPVYLSSGTVTAFSTTVGSSTHPAYMSNGAITACGVQALCPVYIARGATSTSTTATLSSGTTTQVSLVSGSLKYSISDGVTAIGDGGINCTGDSSVGGYLVTGSVYVIPTSSCYRVDVYIYQQEASVDGADFDSATEVASASVATGGSAYSVTATVGPVFIENESDSNAFFLVARCRGSSGTLYKGNASTYLQVQKLPA